MTTHQAARNLSRRRGLAALFAGAAMIAAVACGGGGGGGAAPPPPAGSPPPPPPPAAAPGGLYVGYYAEDPATNPEDPTLGVLHLSLPADDAAFSGQMFFTYVGCQDRNVGTISGNRAGNSLAGTWSGEVDDLAQSGDYNGSFNAANGGFAGTYTVAGGRQERSIAGCIDYVIAPNGTWELFPVGSSDPASFVLAVAGTTVQWTNPGGTLFTLVAVLDEAQAIAGQAGAAVFQAFGDQGVQSFDLASVPGLVPGTRYVVTVAAASDTQRLATGSVVVQAP